MTRQSEQTASTRADHAVGRFRPAGSFARPMWGALLLTCGAAPPSRHGTSAERATPGLRRTRTKHGMPAEHHGSGRASQPVTPSNVEYNMESRQHDAVMTHIVGLIALEDQLAASLARQIEGRSTWLAGGAAGHSPQERAASGCPRGAHDASHAGRAGTSFGGAKSHSFETEPGDNRRRRGGRA